MSPADPHPPRPGATPRRGLLLAAGLLGLAACGGPRERMLAGTDGAYRVERDIPYGAGPRQRLDIYRPEGAAAGQARPIIVYYYGGLWSNGAKDDPSSFVLPQALAARGAIVVVPDYRLYPDVAFPAFMEDAAAALAWTRNEAGTLGGDAGAVFVAGHSSGAHMAVLLALDPRWLAEAEATRPAPRPRPLAGAIGLSGVYSREAFDLFIIRPIFRAAGDRATVLPESHLRPGTPPLLLIHGTWDWRVPPSESTRLAEAARRAGGAAEVRLYPGFGHFDMLSAGPFLPSLSPAADDIAVFVRRRLEQNAAQRDRSEA